MIKKIRILGIAPYKGLATLMKQCALQYPEIEFTAYAGSMEQGLALAKRYSEHYDVIISRANTAKMISQSVHIPVIDIGIGYYDVLRCIKMAQNTGTKFALRLSVFDCHRKKPLRSSPDPCRYFLLLRR